MLAKFTRWLSSGATRVERIVFFLAAAIAIPAGAVSLVSWYWPESAKPGEPDSKRLAARSSSEMVEGPEGQFDRNAIVSFTATDQSLANNGTVPAPITYGIASNDFRAPTRMGYTPVCVGQKIEIFNGTNRVLPFDIADAATLEPFGNQSFINSRETITTELDESDWLIFESSTRRLIAILIARNCDKKPISWKPLALEYPSSEKGK